MRRVVPAFVAALAIAAPLSAQQSDRRAVVARIDSLATDFLASSSTLAISVAVVRGKDTLVMKGYGLADRPTNRAAGPNTIYRIGSITKQFTSAAIMRQVERGKISLDDDMSKYLPDVPLHGNKVTIRQLLNHTSGIHSYTSSPELSKILGQDLTPRQIMAVVDNDPFDFPPGTAWLYNNSGYVLLGMVLEKVTGEPYARHLQRELFTPLGLGRTSYCPSTPTDTSFAAGYAVGQGAVRNAEYLSMTTPFAAGALCSTVGDLVKWQRALVDGRVVNARSYELMTVPDTLNNGKRLNYGFGLVPGNLGGHRSVGHGGGINGFTTSSIFFPADSVNVVVFSNAGAGPDAVALNMARAALGLPLESRPKPAVAVALADADRDMLVGVYEFATPGGSAFVVHVTVENGQLMTQAEGPGQGKFPLIHVGNLQFGAAFDPSLRVTFERKDGKITGATLSQGGGTMQGRKR